MKARAMVIVIAVVLGLIAVIGVAAYVGRVKSQVADEGRRVNVVVAEKEITAGTSFDDLLKNNMIKVRSIPKRYVASDAVYAPWQVKGRITKAYIGKGEQLTQNRFESSLKTAAINLRISESMRAVAIPFDEVKAVAGMIIPGDKVDVVATFDKEIAGTDTTRIILQNVEVLSVTGSESVTTQGGKPGVAAASSSQTSSVKKTIVLAVSATDVEKLIFAEKKGSVWLALVPTKASTVQTSGQTINSVLK
ncbi:MAG: Flp pilus assembly protein CpaB [Actinomycetota bacterium]